MKFLPLSLALILFPLLAWGQTGGVSLSPTQEKRAVALGDQLRCLVCQNESVEDSTAALAAQLRQIIRQQISAGASNQQVRRYMVQRYGIFILLKPPISPLTGLLYASPFLALLVGCGVFYRNCRQCPKLLSPLTKAEQVRLDELLK